MKSTLDKIYSTFDHSKIPVMGETRDYIFSPLREQVWDRTYKHIYRDLTKNNFSIRLV